MSNRECGETVCHCNVKENAELIAKIMDYDVDGKVCPEVVEVKCGEWIVKNTERRKVFYCSKRIAHCPYCGHMEDRKIPKFCSECGADLRGEKNE